MHIINVGMDKPAGGYVTAGELAQAVYESRALVQAARIAVVTHENGTEQTWVAHVKGLTEGAAHDIAEKLGQDCIAVYDIATCTGALIGPNASSWGEFNPDFFRVV
jgi:hypothetical protein